LVAVLCGAIVLSFGGCSDSKTPQQRFVEALQRGNAPEASQVWLHMTPQQRADFSHGVGMTPEVSQQSVKNVIIRHEMEQAEQGGEPLGGGQNQVTITPEGTGGTLLDLPSYAPSAKAPSADDSQ
jgi:hypothetical protein